jgi:hypothetical protein
MLSKNAPRGRVTTIIIAFHHAMFENTGSVTGVTGCRVWQAIADQKVYVCDVAKAGKTGGENPRKIEPLFAAF